MYAFGLYVDKDLRWIVTYGQPASPYLCRGVCGDQYAGIVIELTRLCVDDHQKNFASMLIGRSLKKITGPRVVVSYADCGHGHVGYVYQATNWIYTGITKERTDIFSPSGHSRHHCGDTSKRQPRSSKHRYVYFVGDRRTKVALMSSLKYPKLPYPKGPTTRYDASSKFAKQTLLF